ncbi:MAG: hypothetical protein IKG87_08760 [Clostridia bacterium]|nr:hypothetical protein [Clostridia bacterium]
MGYRKRAFIVGRIYYGIKFWMTQITELNKRIAQMEETISKAAAILGKERK